MYYVTSRFQSEKTNIQYWQCKLYEYVRSVVGMSKVSSLQWVRI